MKRYGNLLTAISNIACLIPIYYTYQQNDFITLYLALFVSLTSIISHLAENHKHQMPGLLNVSKRTSYLLNRMDVLGSGLLATRLLFLYWTKYGLTINPLLNKFSLMLLIPFPFGIMSEWNKETIYPYLYFHPIWHLTIYPTIAGFLYYFIY